MELSKSLPIIFALIAVILMGKSLYTSYKYEKVHNDILLSTLIMCYVTGVTFIMLNQNVILGLVWIFNGIIWTNNYINNKD